MRMTLLTRLTVTDSDMGDSQRLGGSIFELKFKISAVRYISRLGTVNLCSKPLLRRRLVVVFLIENCHPFKLSRSASSAVPDTDNPLTDVDDWRGNGYVIYNLYGPHRQCTCQSNFESYFFPYKQLALQVSVIYKVCVSDLFFFGKRRTTISDSRCNPHGQTPPIVIITAQRTPTASCSMIHLQSKIIASFFNDLTLCSS